VDIRRVKGKYSLRKIHQYDNFRAVWALETRPAFHWTLNNSEGRMEGSGYVKRELFQPSNTIHTGFILSAVYL